MPTIVSKSLFVVIRLQFSSTKTFFLKIRKSHKITKQHRIKGQKFYLTDVTYVCTKTVPDSTKLWLIKGPKSNFPRGACPRTPLVCHILCTRIRIAPPPPPLGKKLKETLTYVATFIYSASTNALYIVCKVLLSVETFANIPSNSSPSDLMFVLCLTKHSDAIHTLQKKKQIWKLIKLGKNYTQMVMKKFTMYINWGRS